MTDTMERSATDSPIAVDVVSEYSDSRLDLDGTIPDKISAYYSLAFPNFTYYLQTLAVTIGRRAVRTGSASTSDAPQVDVDLGPLKSVSRLHARIEYEEENEQFVLVVLGRNGAWVDGIWSGSGSRVPLGLRSQIQIATRIFHFILPPAPVPEDSPSPSSPTSSSRHPSPSIDITSLGSSPSPVQHPAELPQQTAAVLPLPGKRESSVKTNKKKRKKSEADIPEPVPEYVSPRPPFTYAQLCYRAIKSMDGKATLQDICRWIVENYEWFKFNKGCGWENSIRHNLSSNRAFKKMERSSGERGKGFFWSLDSRFEAALEQQEAKTAVSATASGSDAKEGGKGKAKFKTSKNTLSTLEPPLKRSIKGEPKMPLPPPLTTTPLAAFASSSSNLSNNKAILLNSESSLITQQQPTTELLTNPSLTSIGQIMEQNSIEGIHNETSSADSQNTSVTGNTNDSLPSIPPDMVVPIVIGPTTPTSENSANNIAPHLTTPPIALRGDTIILNPTIFRDLTPEQLKSLEALGARKAIDVLQGYIVRFLKQQIKTEGARGKARGRTKARNRKDGKGEKTDTSQGGSTEISRNGNTSGESKEVVVSIRPKKADISQTPFTTTPLPLRQSQNQPQTLVSAMSEASISTTALSTSTAPSTSPPTPDFRYQNGLAHSHLGIAQPSVQVASTSPPMGHLELNPAQVPDEDIIIDIEGPVPKKRRIEVEA